MCVCVRARACVWVPVIYLVEGISRQQRALINLAGGKKYTIFTSFGILFKRK